MVDHHVYIILECPVAPYIIAIYSTLKGAKEEMARRYRLNRWLELWIEAREVEE